MDESNVVPINQNTAIQQPAVAAESGEAGAGTPAPAEPSAATDSHASANAELAEKLEAAGETGSQTTEPEPETPATVAPHPAHGVLDEIEKKLATELRTVSAASLAWLREKLADIRKSL